jgi:antitoxin component YwqK of YwqJK toxin-antitoxin module
MKLLQTACGFVLITSCPFALAQDTPRVLPGVRSVIRSAAETSDPTGDSAAVLTGGQESDPSDAELITERYPSGAVKTQRWVILDAAGNFINHGSYKAYDQNGKVIGTGEYRNGKEHGKWTRQITATEGTFLAQALDAGFEAPFISEAPLIDGQLNGTWTVRDKAGRPITQFQFENGIRQGASSWWYSTGQKRSEVTYKDGLMHGNLVVYGANQQPEIKSVYYDGRRLTTKTETYAKGQKMSEGSYLSPVEAIEIYYDWWNLAIRTAPPQQSGPGVKHGTWTYWHANGKLRMQGEYKEDLPVGKFTWWYENGQKQAEGEYVAGRQENVWVGWHPNGMKKYKGDYEEGVQQGVWMVWKEDGRRSEIHEYNEVENAEQAPPTESIVTDEETPGVESYGVESSQNLVARPASSIAQRPGSSVVRK